MFSKTGVYYENDTVNGQGGFSDVGGHDYFAPDRSVGFVRRRRLEDPLLQVWRKSGIQRNALEFTNFRPKVVDFSLYPFAGFFNFLQRKNNLN